MRTGAEEYKDAKGEKLIIQGSGEGVEGGGGGERKVVVGRIRISDRWTKKCV